MAMPGMSQRWINVDLLTTEYRVVGRVLIGGSGMYGLFNDSTKSFIEIDQAQIAYLRQPAQVVRRFESTYVIKNHINVACLDRRDYAGPLPYGHRSYSKYQDYPLHVSVGGFELNCTIQWTGRFDIAALLVDKLTSFMLVQNATIDSATISDLSIETPAAMVNMNRVDLISLAPRTEITGANLP